LLAEEGHLAPNGGHHCSHRRATLLPKADGVSDVLLPAAGATVGVRPSQNYAFGYR
jgi:hypothetical protein